MRRGARGVLFHRFQHPARDDGVLTQPRADGLRQQHLELPAMHGELRQRIAGIQAARLAPDRLSELVVVVQLRGFDGAFGQAGQQAQ
ncbi:hypothetical protein G6F68_019882 [Rhizopus microsporus]|nr:hypothetical protein G6F68_019882 [Rhizopus microsporus]